MVSQPNERSRESFVDEFRWDCLRVEGKRAYLVLATPALTGDPATDSALARPLKSDHGLPL